MTNAQFARMNYLTEKLLGYLDRLVGSESEDERMLVYNDQRELPPDFIYKSQDQVIRKVYDKFKDTKKSIWLSKQGQRNKEMWSAIKTYCEGK